MSEVYTVSQLQGLLTPVFQKNNVKKATLFGSYSKGKATIHSDVDILVDSGLRGLAFFGLVDDVCESLDCDVDLIDIRDVTPDSKVDREIRNTGVVIYEQKQIYKSQYGARNAHIVQRGKKCKMTHNKKDKIRARLHLKHKCKILLLIYYLCICLLNCALERKHYI